MGLILADLLAGEGSRRGEVFHATSREKGIAGAITVLMT